MQGGRGFHAGAPHGLQLSFGCQVISFLLILLDSFGLFRSPVLSRVYGPELASFLPSIHLGLADVALNSMSSPSCLRLHIKVSKTDPFRKGCFLHIGRGEFPLCAMRSPLAYLTLRGNALGPVFLFHGRQPLTCALLTSWLRDILSSVCVQGFFSSHSFRIGAATVAAKNGIPDNQIQDLGQRTSWTYLSYIRTPVESLILNCLSSFRSQLPAHSTNWINRDLCCFTGLVQFITE